MENKNNRIKIALIGDQNTGKTKFAHYIINKSKIAEFSDYQPTIGGSYCSKNITYNNKCYILDIWDTSGQERYESLTILFYRDAKIILLFFNYNNKKSFQRAKHFLTKIKTVNKEPDLVIILIGNKYDEKNYSDNNNNNLNEEEVLEYAQENNLLFTHLSILEKYSNGINEIFDKIINEYIIKMKNK